MERIRFLVGIGSQRAGSTLLHQILERCTRIYMHPLKELHYFDTWHQVRDAQALRRFSKRQLEREIDRITKSDNFGFINRRYKNYLRSNFLLLTREVQSIEYLDLFRPCLLGHDCVGEITPEYMILPEHGVAHLRDVVGSDAKIILMVRDPIERTISAFKLLHAYQGKRVTVEEANEGLRKHMDEESKWISVQDRFNDYESAIALYAKYFDNVLSLSYEELTRNPGAFRERLEKFLGSPIEEPEFSDVISSKVNAIGESPDFSAEIRDMLAERYKNSSAYIEKLFEGTGRVA